MKRLRITRRTLRFTLSVPRFKRHRRPSAVRHPQTARAVRLLRAAGRLGVPGASPGPPELLPAGARVLAQGYLNRFALPLLNGWLLPRWMREQSDPASPLFTPRSVINLMANQTARNWTALGIPGAGHSVEATVDTRGLLSPFPGGPSLDWWVRVEGGKLGLMHPSGQSVQQGLQGGLPVVATSYEADGLRVSAEAWAFSGEGGDCAALQVVLFNIADLPLTGDFYFALRPYNPEGIAPMRTLAWDGQSLSANGRRALVTWPLPEGAYFSGLRQGDVYAALSEERQPARRNHMRDPHGFAHAALHFTFNIEPWEEAEFIAFLPMHGDRRAPALPVARHNPLFQQVSEDVSQPDPQVYSRAKAATTLRWREVLGGGMQVSVPHRDLQNSWEANRAHLLALHDGNSITPGPDLYHAFWLRDAVYMLYALSACGYREAAAQLLRALPAHQRRTGAFVSHRGEWDGTGQALWAAARHLELHPDGALADELKPALSRGADWVARELVRGRGLMPAGISSEHLGPPDRYYWDALWSLAGLEAACSLLGSGHDSTARTLRESLTRLWKSDTKRLGREALPAAPGRGIDLGMVGTLAAWFPLRLMPSDSPLLSGTLAALEEAAFYEGALFVHAGHSGWGTYLNMRVAGCRILSGLPGGWHLMRWLLRHASPTLNWPEAIHPRSGGGSAGDGHHGWASAEWLMLVRLLLFDDLGGAIHVTPALPEEWLEKEGSITVKDAPTPYGTLNYTLDWTTGGETLRLHLEPLWRTRPQDIKWSVPGKIAEVRGDGEVLPHSLATVSAPPNSRLITLKRAM